MGKRRIIAETGAGQHGVATATVAARLGLECVVYMGARDIERQQPNVFRMRLLGAEVRAGALRLAHAQGRDERGAARLGQQRRDTFYIIGSVAGPHPYPAMVRDFQSVIGNEAREQIMAKEGRLPDTLVACVGGGSNAMGLFHPFLDDREVRMIGVEAAGHGIETGEHAAALTAGQPGVLHGSRSYLLQDDDGQVLEAHSISAGLDYPGVGPEHAWLKDVGPRRVRRDHRRRGAGAFRLCSELEGILPALEPAHALAQVAKMAPALPSDHLIVMNLCGRGDKDIFTVADAMGVTCERADRAPLRRAAGSGRGGLITFLRGRSRPRDLGRADRGPAGRRRRPDRDRHAVHRPDGRRPGDPGGQPARAQGRA